MKLDKNDIIKEIIEAGRRMYAKDLVASNDGNISARLSDTEVLITATGICKGDLLPEHILTVDMEGNLISGDYKPTSEIKMHLAVYKARPDVMAIAHAHPQTATAFAVARLGLDKISLPEAVFALGKVALADYGTPSTHEIPDAVVKVVDQGEAVLLANHGAITFGKTVQEAYFNMETLEHFAKISLNARMLGGEHFLTEKEAQDLFRIRKDVFNKYSG